VVAEALETTILAAVVVLALIVKLGFSLYQILAQLKRLRLAEAGKVEVVMEMATMELTQHLAVC
tara:strand:- start:395 stop:586 length:192 start_codon:yes stop_codon:yes gene_type:complete